MPISTYVGDTGRPWKYQLNYSDGTHPNILGFTTSNFTVVISNGNTRIVGAGAITIIDGVNGIFAYQPTSADVTTAGTNFQVQITVQLPSGPTTFAPDSLTITAKL